ITASLATIAAAPVVGPVAPVAGSGAVVVVALAPLRSPGGGRGGGLRGRSGDRRGGGGRGRAGRRGRGGRRRGGGGGGGRRGRGRVGRRRIGLVPRQREVAAVPGAGVPRGDELAVRLRHQRDGFVISPEDGRDPAAGAEGGVQSPVRGVARQREGVV